MSNEKSTLRTSFTSNPTIETVAKIAKALEVSVDDLINKSKACLPVRSRTAKAG